MTSKQPDLFASPRENRGEPASPVLEEPPADFIDRIRDELDTTLRRAREARALPWPNLTSATLAEIRFHSIARWLPEREAAALRAAFDGEMARIYEQSDASGGPSARAPIHASQVRRGPT